VRILIADDDRVLVHLIGELLRRQAHQVVPVFDAMQAFMFAMRAPLPDAVILDVNMPGGTGLEVLKRLRSSQKTALIPVILLSGASNAGMAAKLAELGADAFLCKPVDPGALFETLGKVMHPV
jgi:DNA-binding response OmpR family regulator